jgi:hypothetical protein
MVRFFQDHKALEGKDIVVGDPLGVGDALRILSAAIATYTRRT